MRIDVHTHFQCLDFVKHLQGRNALPRSILDGGIYFIQCAQGLNLPSFAKVIDIDQKLRHMDETKTDVAVLSHGIPFGPDVLGSREADEWATRINDDLARIIATCPDRFIGFGSIGFGDLRRSIAEVERCVKQLGFRGFQVFSNVSGHSLDSAEVTPVLKHIGKLGVPVHLHPAIPLSREGLDAPGLFLSLGFPYDSSLSTVRLIRSGIFDESPDLKVIVAHAGGVIPYLSGRIGAYAASEAFPEVLDLKHPITRYLSKLYVDTVCYHGEALECCYKVMGARQMLYGTDHPFGRHGLVPELIERLNCPAADRDLIFHGNAQRLMNLESVPAAA
jgi:predicted TIM-barrel fold metal-dependent hydrolase